MCGEHTGFCLLIARPPFCQPLLASREMVLPLPGSPQLITTMGTTRKEKRATSKCSQSYEDNVVGLVSKKCEKLSWTIEPRCTGTQRYNGNARPISPSLRGWYLKDTLYRQSKSIVANESV